MTALDAQLQKYLRGDIASRDALDLPIEAEGDAAETQEAAAPEMNPLFGMWRDRQEMADVAGYIRHIRAPRFGPGDGVGSGN